MDNFIEDSVNYLYYNGGFDLITGYQRFEFRVRKDGEIEVTSINNHIKTVFKGEPDIYQFFAFLIFCDMYSSHQRTTIALCKDKNVSLNNLKALNRVYEIYKTMLMMDGEHLAEALSDEDPGALDRVMLDYAYDEISEEESKLKFSLIKDRIDSYAYYFARRYEYYDNLYQEMITTDEDDPLNEYARIRWEELENNIDANHDSYFTKDEALRILFERTNKLEKDLMVSIEGGELEKFRILNILMSLYDLKVDVMDIIYLVKCAFSACCMDDRTEVSLGDFLEAIEVCYLDDNIKDSILRKLRDKSNNKNNGNIIKFPGV